MRNKFKERIASTVCAIAMLFSSVSNTLALPIKATAEIQPDISDTAESESNKDLNYQSFELYPNGEDAEQVITLDGMMPDGAEADAIDVSDDYDGLVAYDITITAGNSEYQPGESNPILVEISDPSIPDSNHLELWHIKDDGEREQVTYVTIESGKISFYATGFSVYEIVVDDDIAFSNEGWQKVSSIEQLTSLGNSGLYIGNPLGYYFMNTTTGDNTRMGITKSTPAETYPSSNAALYYFEKVDNSDNQYYVYCYNGDDKQYVYNGGNNSLSFSTEENKTAFTVNYDSTKGFRFNNGAWYWNMQGGVNGTRFCSYNTATDGNNYLDLWYYTSISDDPYNLDGKTYGLMNFTGGTHGYAIVAEDNNVHSLIELVTHQTADAQGVTLYVDEGSEVTMWTFHAAGEDKYKLSANTDDGLKYLAIDGDTIILTDSAESASDFKVTPDNNGKIQLSSDGKYVTYISADDNGVTTSSFSLSSNASSSNSWLSLLNTAHLSDNDLITFSADRISVSDAVNGQKVIVYTRIWDDINKKYDMYAIDYNGTLYPCYASGGKILWLGDGTGSLEWEFTEYYDAVTKQPNYYYELYNSYSDKYIAPQISNNQILSDDTIGINMQGRRNGDFYSEIVAWDNTKYAYIGMKPNDEKTKLIPCSQSACVPFYFATLEPLNLNDRLHELQTVDNNQHGITIKMQDFESRSSMSSFLGSDAGGAVQTTDDNLLSSNLGENGYPTVTSSGKSLAELYNAPQTVNHLFLESVYNSSGYFEFDSCQNFATLCNDDGTLKSPYNYTDSEGNVIPTIDFTVYRELGTSDNDDGCTRKHGQFFPYDNIVNKPISKHQNTYSSLTNPNGDFGELPESDPRKYERMFNVGNNKGTNQSPNYYNGMELEASFVQTVSGLDSWGHDIIFEFTGDDDFWLYVDDELVIDLGGIHSALQASVNFRTGAVTVNKNNKTLKQIFIDNFTKRYKQEHNGDEPSENDIKMYLLNYFQPDESKPYGVEDIFADYSTHTMRIFYMERGAGASNLHMRFNIASVTPGHVSLSKKVSGDGADGLDMDFLEYPFQIYYTVDENGNGVIDDSDTEVLLENTDEHIHVTYQNTNQPVTFIKRYRPPGFTDEQAYKNIYFINPTKNAEISSPDTRTIAYRIVECAVDSTVYNDVTINGEAVPDTRRTEISGFISYSSDTVTAETRPTISFDNHVTDDVIKDLYVTKRLLDKNNQDITDDSATFNFRLYISSVDVDADSIPAANMYKYYVLSPSKKMCKYDSGIGGFIETDLPYSREAMKALNAYCNTDPDDDDIVTAYNETHTPAISSYSLTPEDVTYNTSGFGAISQIPARYTICVPNLPVGTLFKVTEDVKTGYGLDGYERLFGDKTDAEGHVTQVASYQVDEGNSDNIGRIIAEQNPQMEVHNKKGYGLTVNKKWSDLDITTYHDTIYVAVYVDGVLLDGSVKQIASPSTSAYYFWESLKDNRTSLEDYAVKEVLLSGDSLIVADDNTVTGYDSITPLDSGAEIPIHVIRTVEATPDGESQEFDFNYIVAYDQNSDNSSTRTDTITNTREGGLQLRLFQWDSAIPLKDGKFTLTDSSGQTVGSYTSDSAGTITILYNFEKNSFYTLKQTAAPRGYVGLSIPLRFRVNDNDEVELFYNDGVTEWGTKTYADNPQRDDDDWANWKSGGNGITAYIDVYNKPFNFKIMKTDSEDSELKLGSAHFALYKQAKTTIIGYVKPQDPMTGFEDLVTVNGVVDVCGGDSGRVINPGANGAVFFLTETEAPFNYNRLDEDIIFSISALGVPSLISDSYNGQLIEEDNAYIYTLSVPNTKKDPNLTLLTIEKQVNGAYGNKDRDFSFTIEITGADEGDAFTWAKNGEEQTGMPRTGGTFTMKHEDRIEIALPTNVTVKITEDNGEYTTSFKLGEQPASNGNSITFDFTDATKLIVTNTLNGEVATGIASTIGTAIALTAIPILPIGYALYFKRRRKKLS